MAPMVTLEQAALVQVTGGGKKLVPDKVIKEVSGLIGSYSPKGLRRFRQAIRDFDSMARTHEPQHLNNAERAAFYERWLGGMFKGK
jgi:hypothetical protein